jgi:TrmH family RNA methyltransferase
MPAPALSRADARFIHALHRRKARDAQGFFLAEGLRVVEELVASELPLKLAVVSSTLEDSPRGRDLKARLTAKAPVSVVSEHALRETAATENPQGVLAVARVPEATLTRLEPDTVSRILICDGVQDPGNLGTLIRAADAFAATAVILLSGTVDAWNAKVVRSAAGSSFRMPLVPAETAELHEWLHEHNYRVLGADSAGDAIDPNESAPRIALVVGNEGAGLRPETRDLLDGVVRIDMPGNAESLNVAVAAGILLYLFSRGPR